MQRSQQIFDSQEGMVILAHETGGLFMQNTNDIYGALRQRHGTMAKATTSSATIPTPPPSTPKPAGPSSTASQVRVKRAGLHVRYRSGFFGTSDRETAPVPRTRSAQIAHAMTSPSGTGALHLRLTSALLASRQKRAASSIPCSSSIPRS